MKKLTCILIITVLVAAFGGCQSYSEGTAEATEESFIPAEDPVGQKNDSLQILISGSLTLTGRREAIEREFAKKYPDIDIEYIEPRWEERETTLTKLAADILAGKGPDLVVLDANAGMAFDSIDKMMAAGAFYDLNQFLVQDENFREEDYMEAALEAGRLEGCQYVMPMSVSETFYITTEELLREEGLVLDADMNYGELLSKLGDYAQTHTLPAAFGPTREQTLYLLNYVDRKEQTVAAEQERVQEALENFCKISRQDVSGSYHFEANAGNLINKSCNLLYWEEGFHTMGTLGILSKSTSPVILPVRDMEGRIHTKVMQYCAIPSQSPNKQCAYDYMMLCLTQEPLPELFDGASGIPVYKPNYRATMNTIKASLKAGNLYSAEQQEYLQSDVEGAPLKENLYQELDALYEQIEYCSFMTQADEIFREAVQPCLEGKADAAQCLKDAQEKLEVYVSE